MRMGAAPRGHPVSRYNKPTRSHSTAHAQPPQPRAHRKKSRARRARRLQCRPLCAGGSPAALGVLAWPSASESSASRDGLRTAEAGRGEDKRARLAKLQGSAFEQTGAARTVCVAEATPRTMAGTPPTISKIHSSFAAASSTTRHISARSESAYQQANVGRRKRLEVDHADSGEDWSVRGATFDTLLLTWRPLLVFARTPPFARSR